MIWRQFEDCIRHTTIEERQKTLAALLKRRLDIVLTPEHDKDGAALHRIVRAVIDDKSTELTYYCLISLPDLSDDDKRRLRHQIVDWPLASVSWLALSHIGGFSSTEINQLVAHLVRNNGPDLAYRTLRRCAHLTTAQRARLKSVIIAGGDPNWAYRALYHLRDITAAERALFLATIIKSGSLRYAYWCLKYLPKLSIDERDKLLSLVASITSPEQLWGILFRLRRLSDGERRGIFAELAQRRQGG